MGNILTEVILTAKEELDIALNKAVTLYRN